VLACVSERIHFCVCMLVGCVYVCLFLCAFVCVHGVVVCVLIRSDNLIKEVWCEQSVQIHLCVCMLGARAIYFCACLCVRTAWLCVCSHL